MKTSTLCVLVAVATLVAVSDAVYELGCLGHVDGEVWSQKPGCQQCRCVNNSWRVCYGCDNNSMLGNLTLPYPQCCPMGKKSLPKKNILSPTTLDKPSTRRETTTSTLPPCRD